MLFSFKAVLHGFNLKLITKIENLIQVIIECQHAHFCIADFPQLQCACQFFYSYLERNGKGNYKFLNDLIEEGFDNI